MHLIPFFVSVLLPEFKLDDKAKAYISQGKKNFEAFCNSLDINYIEVLEYGRKDCRKFAVSPDSLMQLTFQVRVIYKFCKVCIAAACSVHYRCVISATVANVRACVYMLG